jgi:DNA-binding GntR family transcriptional regulator
VATSFKSDLPEVSESLRSGSIRLHDLAYAYLKDLLFSGGLEPGDQISTEGVGRALSVSRAPVSDAIRRLTVEGLLEVHPQIGCRVVTPVPAEVADFYQLFAATEGVIARMAAERRTPDQAEGLRELLTVLADQRQLPEAPEGRRAEHRRRNRRRYERLHELAGTPMSTAIAESFWDRSDFFIRAAFGQQSVPTHVTTSHDLLFQAVIDGDGDTAEHQTRQALSQLGHDVAHWLGHVDASSKG